MPTPGRERCFIGWWFSSDLMKPPVVAEVPSREREISVAETGRL
jgi:hypothetical protein